MKLISTTKLKPNVYLFKYLDEDKMPVCVAADFNTLRRTARSIHLSEVMLLNFSYNFLGNLELIQLLYKWKDKCTIINYKGDL